MHPTTLTARRIAVVLATGAAAIAVAAPAQADPWAQKQPYQSLTTATSPRPDDRAGPRGIGATSSTSAPRVTSASAGTVARPDDRAGVHGIGAPAAARAADVSSSSFSWKAFGIGAAAMLGLVLLAAGLIVAGRMAHGTPRVRTS